jgi:hypothetical protein
MNFVEVTVACVSDFSCTGRRGGVCKGAVRLMFDVENTRFVQGKTSLEGKKVKSYGRAFQSRFSLMKSQN